MSAVWPLVARWRCGDDLCVSDSHRGSARSTATDPLTERGSAAPAQLPRARLQWLNAALAVAAVGWGAQQFAPLLLLYREELGLSATAIQSTFGLYVVGLLPGLLLGGPVSDRLGRRRVVYISLVTSVIGTVLLMFGGASAPLLFLGRLVAGIASGAAFSAGSTWIKELSSPLADGTNPAPRRLTIAMSVGFGLGPLVAGVLAQWAPAPTVTLYIPHLVLAVVSIVLLGRAVETSAHPPAERSRLGLAELGGKRFLFVVVPLAPWVFGSASIALAYMPGQVASRLGDYGLIYSAIITTLTATAGIAIQPLARRLADPERPRLLVVSMTFVLAGALIAAAAAAAVSPVLVVVAALVFGAGYGSCQVCGLAEVQRLAPASHLARATAVYQAISYIGFAAPYPLAAAERVLAPTTLLVLVAALALLTLITVLFGARLPAPSTRPTSTHESRPSISPEGSSVSVRRDP